jgi:predicted nucleic acid-binding protein
LTLVIDASVAVKWMVREPGNDVARELFELPDPLVAPDWLLIEAASTFWKKVKGGELLELHAERHLQDLPEFFSRLYESHGLAHAALGLSFRLRHSVYDCLYLALAVRENCQVVTADVGFFEAMKRVGFDSTAVLLEY